ncbi:MAG: TetR/AcrR family transcriptional regulator [Paludibacteraceae bacterium]|nr:TetR/AcrR family transcriptional regulator [Paludibacteraceae bacterium]
MKTTKDEIIKAAAYLFMTEGYHEASVSKISSAVGLQKGSLFSHFSCKEEIYLKVVDRFILSQQKPAEKFGDISNCSLYDFLGIYLKNVDRVIKYLQHIFDPNAITPVDYISFVLQASKKIEASKILFMKINQEELDVWEEIIQRAKDNGEIKGNIDVAWAAQMFRYSFNGMSYIFSIDGGVTINQLEEVLLKFYNTLKKD